MRRRDPVGRAKRAIEIVTRGLARARRGAPGSRAALATCERELARSRDALASCDVALGWARAMLARARGGSARGGATTRLRRVEALAERCAELADALRVRARWHGQAAYAGELARELRAVGASVRVLVVGAGRRCEVTATIDDVEPETVGELGDALSAAGEPWRSEGGAVPRFAGSIQLAWLARSGGEPDAAADDAAAYYSERAGSGARAQAWLEQVRAGRIARHPRPLRDAQAALVDLSRWIDAGAETVGAWREEWGDLEIAIVVGRRSPKGGG